MDLMCMKTDLSFLSLVAVPSPVPVSSSSAGQVGQSKVSEVTSSSRVVPLTSGRVCSLVIEPIPPQSEGGVTVIVLDLGTGPIQSLMHKFHGGLVHLKPGIICIQPWVPDFNPSLQKSTNAHVWVRFFDLSCEYWHLKIISDLAREIGVPLWLDKATRDGDFGHYARVLVDMDESSVLPISVLLERDGFHSSFLVVEYENLLAFAPLAFL
ncbi:hypothetical protein Dsin_012724 [Dipteronia sinensis]|uniref:DUF4283 domain-containing protein n=1 Tax=Dipteronia sinensis TaxID=43782 RepID=A0AAE0E8F9_9ROSI|nr:hypothetical protein Dsin_012724 [Dipteronia sinensis]